MTQTEKIAEEQMITRKHGGNIVLKRRKNQHVPLLKNLENVGFEPTASRLQSERSATELDPLKLD